MKTNELIKRIRKQAADDAQRKNKAKINWLCILIGLMVAAILFFTINWSGITDNIEKMSLIEKIITLPIGALTAIALLSLVSNLVLGGMILYFIGWRAKSSQQYYLPLLKKGVVDFVDLKNGNEVAELFALFQLEIFFWQRVILNNAQIADKPHFRKYYWEKSGGFTFAKLKYLFNERLKCQGEAAPIIDYAPYFVKKINSFFQINDTGANSRMMMADLARDFKFYEDKAKIELNEWLDRNISAILSEIQTQFGEAELGKPIWREFIDAENVFKFDFK